MGAEPPHQEAGRDSPSHSAAVARRACGAQPPTTQTTKRRAATFPPSLSLGWREARVWGSFGGVVWAWPAWASSSGMGPVAFQAPTCQRDSGQGHCPRGQKPLQERARAPKAQEIPSQLQTCLGRQAWGRGWGTPSGWAGQGWARSSCSAPWGGVWASSPSLSLPLAQWPLSPPPWPSGPVGWRWN